MQSFVEKKLNDIVKHFAVFCILQHCMQFRVFQLHNISKFYLACQLNIKIAQSIKGSRFIRKKWPHSPRFSQDATTPLPLLSTDEPICPIGELACGNRKCIPRDLFCDGQIDCADASDESWCDPEHDPNTPGRCDLSNCTLPDCFCSVDGTRIPGDLKPEETPQMVVLTFDDAVNNENWEIYQKVFASNRTNANGCP